MATVVGATVARADDFDRDGYDDGYRQAVPVGHDCGPRPTAAPQGQTYAQGRYELQTVQAWVPGQFQQVWVPGECRQHHRWQRCSQGYYRSVNTPGHYETRQNWVWVASSYAPYQPQYGQPQPPYVPPQPQPRYGYRASSAGFHVAVPTGSFSVSVY